MRQDGALSQFSLDFGAFKIHGVKAKLEGEPSSIRLPATVLRSGRSEPEIDFLSPDLEKAIKEKLLRHPGENRGPGPTWIPASAGMTKIHIASLEPIPVKRGSRLAEAEIWIADSLAVKVSLMRSKWSEDPASAWVAYPSVWRKDLERYEDSFIVQDKELKKRIREILIDAYLERWGGDSSPMNTRSLRNRSR